LALIQSHLDSGLAVITLNDSEHGNRLNKKSLEALSLALCKHVTNTEVRAILLRSDGNPFCLGMDLDFFQQIEGDKKKAYQTIEIYSNLLLSIYDAPKPVVSLINGDVKAGGMGLVVACDVIITSERSTFELSEVLLGLIPANVLPFLFFLRVPPQKARSLILTAKKLTAVEAKNLNLVDEVFSEEDLEKGAKSIIKNLFRAAPHAMAEAKHFTRDILLEDVGKACGMAKAKLMDLISRKEVIEAISAFNEGRVPSWFAKFKPKKPLVK
jgi:enoyl-CoA hydratase/carnithine racemase